MRTFKMILLSSALLLSVGAQASYKDAYKAGTKAASDQNWRLVQSKMNEALADNPSPQARVRLYGMVFEPYVPHYYLGLAAYKLGDCPGALKALGAPGHSAAMQESNNATLQASEQQILATCRTRPPTPPVSPVLPPPPLPVAQLSAAELSAVQSALGALQNELNSTSTLYQQPALSSSAGAGRLRTLRADAATLGADLTKARSANDAALLASVRTRLSSANSELQRIKQQGQQLLASTPTLPLVTPPVTPPPVTPPPPPPVARVPAPPALAQLAQSYFAGDLAAAARTDLSTLQGKALAHALLLRAAARYSLYVQAGESDSNKLNLIRADLRQAKLAQPGIRPSTRFFSPRLIELFGAA